LRKWLSVNGEIVAADNAHMDPADRGLLLGEGLFETLYGENKRPHAFQAHWQRFMSGCQRLNLKPPLTAARTQQQITELINLMAIDGAFAVRWTLTGGAGARGLQRSQTPQPNFLITLAPITNNTVSSWRLMDNGFISNEYASTANVKSTNYLEAVLAHNEARHQAYDDAVMRNTQGQLISGTMANLFFIDNQDIVHIPAISEGILPGVTREEVIHLLSQFGYQLHFRAPRPEDLAGMRSVFLTNSLKGVIPVAAIADWRFDVTACEFIQKAHSEYVAKQMATTNEVTNE